MYTTLISVSQLQQLRADSQPLMVFDCSFELMRPEAGDVQYQESHIAGAVRSDLDRHLSAKGAVDAASGGRHPLPSRDAFAAWLGQVGFMPDMQAVVYDRQGVNYCGRLWWMLKWAGHEAVAVLDGGLPKWIAEGNSVSVEIPAARPAGRVVARPAPAMVRSSVDVLDGTVNARCCVVDARAPERFRGEVEPLDPVAGLNGAGDLQTEDWRGTRRWRIDPLALQQVGAVDAGRCDPDQHLVRAWQRSRPVDQMQDFRSAGGFEMDVAMMVVHADTLAGALGEQLFCYGFALHAAAGPSPITTDPCPCRRAE